MYIMSTNLLRAPGEMQKFWLMQGHAQFNIQVMAIVPLLLQMQLL